MRDIQIALVAFFFFYIRFLFSFFLFLALFMRRIRTNVRNRTSLVSLRRKLFSPSLNHRERRCKKKSLLQPWKSPLVTHLRERTCNLYIIPKSSAREFRAEKRFALLTRRNERDRRACFASFDPVAVIINRAKRAARAAPAI